MDELDLQMDTFFLNKTSNPCLTKLNLLLWFVIIL